MTLQDYVNFKLTHADKVAEAEGYPLKMENCKKYKKMKDLKVYGDSFQDGTPTPDAPVEVVSVGDKTKNLIPFPYANMSATHNGVTFTVNNDGTITANGTATGGTAYIIICKAGDNPFPTGTYTMSGVPTADTYMMFSGINVSCTSGQSITFTIEEGQAQNFITCCVYSGRTVNNVVFKPMIQEGSTATSYEPYSKYKIPVVARGINLFCLSKTDAKEQTINGITFTPLGDERVHIKGKAIDETKAFSFYYRATKTGNMPIKRGTYRAKPTQWVWVGLTLMFGCNNGSKGQNINSLNSSVSLDMDNGYIGSLYIGLSKDCLKREWDDIIELQLMEGNQNLPYEPYIEPVTTNIFLDEPLRKIGDYADYVDFKENKVVRNIDKVLVDTSVYWGYYNINIDKEDILSIYREGFINYTYLPNHQILSSFFPYYHWNNIVNDVDAVWCAGASAGFKISTDLIDGYDYSWSKKQKIEAFLNWAESIGLDWHLIRKEPTEEPLSLDLPKLNAKTSIIEVDTSLAPSNAYGKYIKK